MAIEVPAKITKEPRYITYLVEGSSVHTTSNCKLYVIENAIG